ncbi:MAG: hypothetical protein ORN23_09855 [Chthoniobacterales bacterium]|nr:hypothetical protein [Chthoniobacterales bacterium]
MRTGRHFGVLALMAIGCHGAQSMDPANARMTEPQKKAAVFLDVLSVPSPGEVFAAINKACRPNWATLVTPATAPVTTERPQLALAVGVLTANGYVAEEAQDGQQVKNVGRELMALAKSLGVSQSLLGRGNSLMEFADNNDWNALADELEATENEVKNTMMGQKDRDLVVLTSAAAWLRGLEVATGVVLSNDSLQGAGVLYQPELARRLATQLDSLPDRIKSGALVQAVKRTMETTASLLEAQDTKTDTQRENYTKIHHDCSAVVKAILSSSMKAPSTVSSPVPVPTPSKS